MSLPTLNFETYNPYLTDPLELDEVNGISFLSIFDHQSSLIDLSTLLKDFTTDLQNNDEL